MAAAGRVVCAAAALLLLMSTANAENNATAETDELMKRLEGSKLIGGILGIQKSGRLVYERAFGNAVVELKVPMQPEYIFPLGSNAKFYTSVAIHQLAAKGLLNTSEPVNGYLDPADFPGLQGKPWCPLVHGLESLGCQKPTFSQVLTLTSGLLPVDLGGCGTPASWEPGMWFYKYKEANRNISYADVTGVEGNLFDGTATSKDILNYMRVLERPLLFQPGDRWCYEDQNYNILGYIVEKLSNSSLHDYMEEHIFAPLNLSNAFYWTGGQGMQPDGLHFGVVPMPGYYTTFRGDPATYQRDNRKAWWPGELSLEGGAASSVYSNIRDMLTFINTVIVHPEALNLTKEAVTSLTTPIVVPLLSNGSKNSNFTDGEGFAKGVSALGSPGQPHGVEFLGSQWGTQSVYKYYKNDEDPSKSDAIFYFSNTSPAIPLGANGNCSVLAANNSTIRLSNDSCNQLDQADNNDFFNDWILAEVTEMWNLTGGAPPSTA